MAESNANPYVGPRPFAADEASRFFGRENEASDLLSLILAYPVTILYSESGAGKTSLLNASIIPSLVQSECDVIGPLRVCANLPGGFAPASTANIYVLSTLLFIEREAADLEKLSQLSLREYLQGRRKLQTPHAIRPPRVLVFDQFEQLFTSRPERWQDRARFFEDIGRALDDDPRLRVVFAMREEFLASIEPFVAELPEGVATRFHLTRLGPIAALEAIECPVRGSGVSYEPGAADRLVENLLRLAPQPDGRVSLAEFVEPVHLQVVCHRIWQALARGATSISIDAVTTTGDVDDALTAYYDGCVSSLAAELKRPEGQLRSWFQRNFITPDGTRALVHRTARETAGLPNNVIEAFQSRYLVRAEVRAGSRWYEIAHDRLIAPIITSNTKWRREHDRGTISVEMLEARAQEWRALGRPAELLLNRGELALLRASREDTEVEPLDFSEVLQEFLAASDAVREQRRAQRLRRQLLAAFAIVSILLAVALFDRWQREKGRLEERAEYARMMIASNGSRNATRIDGLFAALRAHGNATFKNQYTDLLRDALRAVGPTVWLRHSNGDVQNALFSPKDDHVLTIADKQLCVWNPGAGTPRICLDAPKQRIWREAFFTRSGNFIIARAEPESSERKKTFMTAEIKPAQFEVWNWDKAFCVPQVHSIQHQADVSVSPDDRWLAVVEVRSMGAPASPDRIRIFDLARHTEASPFALPSPGTSFISLSKTGARVMTIDQSAVHVWDRATGHEIGRVPGINGDRTPVIKWAGDHRFFLGFSNAMKFPPTIVTIENNGVSYVALNAPNRTREAYFADDGRLLVKAGEIFDPLRAYVFDAAGKLIATLPPASENEYLGYSRYFTDNTITSVAETDEGCRLATSSPKGRSILFKGARYSELTSLSTTGNKLLSVSSGVARLWSIDSRDIDVARLNDEDLVALSCARLRSYTPLWSKVQQEHICKDAGAVALQARMLP